LLDQHGARLERLSLAAIERARERLAAAAGRLEAGSPLHLLARGYSVSWLEDRGTVAARGTSALRSAAGVEPGATLVTQLFDGRLWSRVERISNDACRP
jgi:exonuclease VII large subunit